MTDDICKTTPDGPILEGGVDERNARDHAEDKGDAHDGDERMNLKFRYHEDHRHDSKDENKN